MHTLRVLPVLLLGAVGLAGPVIDGATLTDEEFNFSVQVPNEIDWRFETLSPDASKAFIKAHMSTEYADTDPPSRADVQVWVYPLSKDYAKKDAKFVAEKWQESVEALLTNTRDHTEGEGTLGGLKAWHRGMVGEAMSGSARMRWDITLSGKYAYIIWVFRTYKAVDDEQLDEEIAAIRSSFKFLREEKVEAHKDGGKAGNAPKAGGSGGDVDPTLVEREQLDWDFWRLEAVKPQGLVKADPLKFEESEKAWNVIARFNGRSDQSSMLMRIYAETDTSKKYTLDQLAEMKLKSFNEKFPDETKRMEPEIDKRFKKFPLVDEGIMMKLVGRRAQPEITFWYLLECKNDRQYQVEIVMGGATAEQVWKKQLEDFLKGFKPTKK